MRVSLIGLLALVLSGVAAQVDNGTLPAVDAGTVAPELAATDAPVEVVATDAPVEVAATDAPTELAATVAPTELATTTDKIVQYCTAGFSYVPGGDCCCGPDCAVSRCGLGSGPNGECCAPEGVVPAGAFAAAPTPERQPYDPVIIETTVVIAPNGTAIANETVIVGGGRRDLATVLDEPTTRRLGAGNCVNGILNTQTSACCASSCGSCGGTGCSTRNGGPGYTGAQACCSSQVNAYPTCSATGGKGPCAAAAAPGSPAPAPASNSVCRSGKSTGSTCCDARCMGCGGTDCSRMLLGVSDATYSCCSSGIVGPRGYAPDCATTGGQGPCRATGSAAPAPAPPAAAPPAPPATSASVCSNGKTVPDSKICCDPRCDACTGTTCSKAITGVYDATNFCCTSGVLGPKNSAPNCSATGGKGPCQLSVATASAAGPSVQQPGPTPAPVTMTSAPAAPATRKRKVGVYVEQLDTDLVLREKALGFIAPDKFDYQLKFQNVNNLDIEEVKKIIAAGRDLILTIEFFAPGGEPTYPDNIYKQINAGVFDAKLEAFAKALKEQVTETVKLRIFHEMNGNWYQWGLLSNVFYSGGNFAPDVAGTRPDGTIKYVPNATTNAEFATALQLYKDATARVMGIFGKEQAKVEWQVVINHNNGLDDTTVSRDRFVPNNVLSKVTQIGMAGFNGVYFAAPGLSFSALFSDAYSQLSGFNKFMFISETSIDARQGPQGPWFEDAFKVFAEGTTFPLLSEVTWFLLDKFDGGTERKYDLNAGGVAGFNKGFTDNKAKLLSG